LPWCILHWIFERLIVKEQKYAEGEAEEEDYRKDGQWRKRSQSNRLRTRIGKRERRRSD
jgi:hypothetical protein